MDLTESDVQSFIVKLWIEGTAEVNHRRLSHGYVTHVSSGERRYVKGLDEVTEFIVEHLEKGGVEVEKRWRMTLWSKRRRRGGPKQD